MNFYEKNTALFRIFKVKLQAVIGALFFIIPMFFDGCLFANQGIIDSLLLELKKENLDTNKVWVYRDLAFYHLENDLDSAVFYSQRGFVLALNLNFISGQIWNLYQKALALEFGDDFEEAMSTYQFALDLAEKSGDLLSVAKLKNAIGAAYYYKSEYTQSAISYQEALNVSESISYLEGMGHALNNLGIIYRYKRNYQKALDTYQKSLTLKVEIGDTVGIINSNYNLGLLFAYLQQYEHSLGAFNAAGELTSNFREDRNLAEIRIGEGVALYHLGKFVEAYGLLEEGLTALKSDKAHERIAALAYLGILKIKKGQSESGLNDLLEANEMVNVSGRLELKKQVSKELATAYELIGQASEAVKYWKIYDQVNDSINNEQRLWAFEEMQAKYELIEKDKQIKMREEALEAEVKNRFLMVMSLILLILVTIFLAYRFYEFTKQETKKENYKQEEGLSSRELDLILINSHLPTPLTTREWDVVQLVELGKSNCEIAAALFVSENTVKTHLKNIFIKTEAQSRTDLVHRLRTFSLITQ